MLAAESWQTFFSAQSTAHSDASNKATTPPEVPPDSQEDWKADIRSRLATLLATFDLEPLDSPPPGPSQVKSPPNPNPPMPTPLIQDWPPGPHTPPPGMPSWDELDEELQSLCSRAKIQGHNLKNDFPVVWAASLRAFESGDAKTVSEIQTSWTLLLNALEDPDPLKPTPVF